jgi:putative membrane protein insertion efficiency factor
LPAAASEASATPGITARVLLGTIRAYKLGISPLLPPACRFEPTCSRYAAEAIRVWGAAEGVRLTMVRLLRCRPGGPSGYDPVPLRETRGTTVGGKPAEGPTGDDPSAKKVPVRTPEADARSAAQTGSSPPD